MSSAEPTWQRLCGLGMEICGGLTAFRKEARLLAFLRRHWPREIEVMLRGAKVLGWRSLKGLAGKDGVGRRWAVEAYWRAQNAERKVQMPTRMKAILWSIANSDD